VLSIKEKDKKRAVDGISLSQSRGLDR